jgi:hypothetical protein
MRVNLREADRFSKNVGAVYSTAPTNSYHFLAIPTAEAPSTDASKGEILAKGLTPVAA